MACLNTAIVPLFILCLLLLPHFIQFLFGSRWSNGNYFGWCRHRLFIKMHYRLCLYFSSSSFFPFIFSSHALCSIIRDGMPTLTNEPKSTAYSDNSSEKIVKKSKWSEGLSYVIDYQREKLLKYINVLYMCGVLCVKDARRYITRPRPIEAK